MCLSCWRECGSPAIDTPAVRDAARASAAVHDFHGAGGGLHIVLDDWNLEDEQVAWCLLPENLAQYGSPDPAERAQEIYAGLAFLALTEDERASALALEEGWWR